MEHYHRAYDLQHSLEGAGMKDIASKIKSITPQEAKEDYEKLRSIPCGEINPASLVGNKAMDIFFFKLRLATKTRGGISFYEWVKDNPIRSPSEKRLYKYELDAGKSPALALYDVFRLYRGSVSAFKPIIARDLYCKYKPTTILDFSAGWGGRCLGAMSLDINYIGFDTNTSLKKAYERMIKTYPHDCKVQIHFQDSSKVDYSKYSYDFVFTSPPYYQKTRPTEGYANMPEYENRDDFNERFFFPVVRETMKHLANGGHYALNVPKDMYDDIKKVLGKADKKYPLYISKRFAGQEGGYGEFIYVWKKKAVLEGGGLPKPTITNELVEVHKSPVGGLGLFAKVDIPANKRILDYEGVKMTLAEFKGKYGDDTRYTYSLRGPFSSGILVGKTKPYLTTNLSHYANESNTPNIYYKSRGVYTKRAVKKGEELFLKYPKNYPRTYTLD